MIDYLTFGENVRRVQERIASACEACGRKPTEVTLLPVTKTQPAAAIGYALRCGLSSVGENRVQDVVEKLKVGAPNICWELIGHLQSNKARVAVAHFSRIQSVDSIKLLRRLERLAAERSRMLAVLLQINVSDDPAKFGVSCKEADSLLETGLNCKHIRVEGLMTIGPMSANPRKAAAAFRRLRQTRERLEPAFGVQLPELSMGMTGDLEMAVQEGSTLVRIGTALFGERKVSGLRRAPRYFKN